MCDICVETVSFKVLNHETTQTQIIVTAVAALAQLSLDLHEMERLQFVKNEATVSKKAQKRVMMETLQITTDVVVREQLSLAGVVALQILQFDKNVGTESKKAQKLVMMVTRQIMIDEIRLA